MARICRVEEVRKAGLIAVHRAPVAGVTIIGKNANTALAARKAGRRLCGLIVAVRQCLRGNPPRAGSPFIIAHHSDDEYPASRAPPTGGMTWLSV